MLACLGEYAHAPSFFYTRMLMQCFFYLAIVLFYEFLNIQKKLILFTTCGIRIIVIHFFTIIHLFVKYKTFLLFFNFWHRNQRNKFFQFCIRKFETHSIIVKCLNYKFLSFQIHLILYTDFLKCIFIWRVSDKVNKRK